MPRKKIPQVVQTKVFMMSRRRCCICFGLDRDDSQKKGQIAHLDKNASNNNFDNLAYLCLDHHDEFDSQTSQSKGLTTAEVKNYRDELYDHFMNWSQRANKGHLLNFLASRITVEDLAEAVVEVASKMYFYGPRHAHDVLTMPEFASSEADTLLKHLIVLDSCASWGLLTYEEEEVLGEEPYPFPYTLISVRHKPICEKIANVIEGWIKERGELNW
jgi:hypothetical protein